ncbi:hypothetical protein SAMN04487995_1622 [Dyadobacter koreensis]|uniref:Uncharacterized protein n=1 Tax=Dyadobacter koreensis TaxID=408657 RepID=A0A1H6SAC7_9BACT|nr:DUF6526 family protein [Dyadobacter koreensis]SEI60695.1 hypothetical protein SAMN04487995_1622 [Dyadobacter koreensis]
MEKQNYKNHVRYYPPHHFVFYPVLLILLGFSIYYISRYEEQSLIWTFMTLTLFMIGYVAFMLRQHYALNNQNRIIRLELRFRYYVLTGQRLETYEDILSEGQLFALRFASDEELPVLVERVLKENTTPDEIKRSIVNWLPDRMRV